MKKITDERLLIKNLKNVRVAFLVQTLGLFAVLTYVAITEGVSEAIGNPFFVVFMLSMAVYSWLNLGISWDMSEHSEGVKRPGPYYRVILWSSGVGVMFGYLAKFGSDGSSNLDAFIVGGVAFICNLISFSIFHFLRVKRYNELED